MRHSDKEKEMREAYEWYINQIAYNYANGEGYYDHGGIGMKQNARRVIGKPLVEPWSLISYNKEDFEKNDKKYTMFTEERFLPTLLVNAGIVKSKSEIKRNKSEFWITLDTLDCLWVKWGKNKIYIIVGE